MSPRTHDARAVLEPGSPDETVEHRPLVGPTAGHRGVPADSRRHGSPPMPSPVPPARSPGVAAFLAACRTADLLTPPQLARAAELVAAAPTPPDAAKLLIAAGLLTRFQAERLLAGRTDGFHLGPYTVLEQVGRGATGRVYRARHRAMNRLVAVKILAGELTRTAADRQALRHGVRSAGRLNHTNIVTAYDANEVGERFYLVLELVDGPNLETLVQERGPLPAAEACELARQAAEGLAHAHARGMLHRDVKPANLLVARPSKSVPEPLVKIADFGIAKPAPTPVPDYVAPEQAHNAAAADWRADLYSLGAVLYFLLTGRPPLPDGTAAEKFHRLLWEEPARVEMLRPAVPPPLAALVHQLLAKHPAARPGSAAEVAARLEAFVGTDGMISFDVPAPHPGQYSFATGQLSGGHPAAEHHPTPASESLPAADASPWERITGENTGAGPQNENPRPRRRGRSRSSGWLGGGFAFAMVLACMAAVGVLVKAMAK